MNIEVIEKLLTEVLRETMARLLKENEKLPVKWRLLDTEEEVVIN